MSCKRVDDREASARESCWPGVLTGVNLVCGRQRDGQARRHPHPRQHPLLTFYQCLPFSPFSQSVIHKRSFASPLHPHNTLVQAPQPAYLPPPPRASLPQASQIHQSSWRARNYPLKQNMCSQMRKSLPLDHTTSILTPMVQAPLLRDSRCLFAGNSRRWRPTT